MPVPALGAPSVLVLLGALDVAVGTDAEVRAGSAPVTPNRTAEAAVMGTLAPAVALQLTRPRFATTVGYAARVFARAPNQLELNRPLLLHRLKAAHAATLTPRTELRLEASGTTGEIDYTAADVALSPGQGSQVDRAVLDYYETTGRVGVRRVLDRRHEVDVATTVGESGTTGEASAALPRHRFVELTPALRTDIGRRDALTAAAPLAVRRLGDVDLAAPGATLAWKHRTTRVSELALAAGAIVVLSEDPPVAYPTLAAATSATVTADRTSRVDARLSLELAPVLDVIRATYRPVAKASGGIDVVPAPRWIVSASVTAFVPASSTPLDPPAAESGFASELALRWQATRTVELTVGGRQAVRAPHPALELELLQPQLWGFVGLRYRDSTGPRPSGLP